MSLRSDIKKYKDKIKPKRCMKVVFNEKDIKHEPNTTWVVFTI